MDFIDVMKSKVQVATRMLGPLRAKSVHTTQCSKIKQTSSQLGNSQFIQPKESKNKYSELSMAAQNKLSHIFLLENLGHFTSETHWLNGNPSLT